MPSKNILYAKTLRLEKEGEHLVLKRDNNNSGRQYYNSSGWNLVYNIHTELENIKSGITKEKDPFKRFNLEEFIITSPAYEILLLYTPKEHKQKRKEIFDKYLR
ncbi:MAG: hypothetical protein ACP5OG_04930 [Candidatus Nanoarchaeia archaeon]